MNRTKIKMQAKLALKGNVFMFFLTILLVSLMTSVSMFFIIGFVLLPIFNVGLYLIGKDLLEGKPFKFERLFEPFKDFDQLIKYVAAGLLVGLIVGVGLILLIVPGIILALALSQTLFLLADDKDLKIMDSLKESYNLMNGYKLDLFVFYLSFIGHYLLVIITFGFYIIYFLPYLQVSLYNYYLNLVRPLKAEQKPEEIETVEAEIMS